MEQKTTYRDGVPPELSDLKEKVKQANPIEEVVRESVPLDKNHKGKCPFHDDSTPSFSVNVKEHYFHCFGCGASGDVFDFIMKIQNIDFPAALNYLAKRKSISIPSDTYSRKTNPPKKMVGFYDYTDESGHLIFQTVRCQPKDFRQRRPDGNGGWLWNLDGIRLVPYNLPEVIKTPSVIIAEGEKDVESLRTLGLTASTNPMGAGKWRQEYNRFFSGKQVVILPDNDDPGRKHSQTIAANLKGIAASIKILELPDLPLKGDVSDWLAQGGTKEELGELIGATPEWTSDLSETSSFLREQPDPNLEPWSFLKKGSELQLLDCKVEWAVDKLIPKQSITLLHGRGGIGKTWICLILAKAVSEGIPFMGLNVQTMPVVFVDFENSLPVLIERIRKIGIDDVWFWHNTNETLPPPKLDSREWEPYKALPKGSLLVFDTLRASQGRDENDSQQMAFVMARLKELRDAGFTILLLHHTPKSNDRTYKGSTVILDLADHVLSLHKVRKNNLEENADDEETADVYYRLGTKDKTRYEPFHLFMAFDPDKGFVEADDPDEEDLRSIHELLGGKGTLNQIQLFDAVKAELNMHSKGKVVGLLKKGDGKYWRSVKVKRSTIYEVLPTVQKSGPLYADSRTEQINTDEGPDNST